MNRNLNSISVMAKGITSPAAGRSPNVAKPVFYETVRYNQKRWDPSRFHKHITYSYKVINEVTRRRPPPSYKLYIDPKTVEPGKPISPSVILGDMSKAREFKFDIASLNARGFLRFQKPYDPPRDAQEKVIELCRSCLSDAENDPNLMKRTLGDSRQKFELLTKTHKEFQHAVPNSLLHIINTVGDLVEFYCTPVKTLTPYEELQRNPDLPRNIHVQKEPLRFHPDTDGLFGGETAYTKSSTIVTGLRAKKKYQGYQAKMTWP